MIAGVDFDTFKAAICLLEAPGAPPRFLTVAVPGKVKDPAVRARVLFREVELALVSSVSQHGWGDADYRPLYATVHAWWIELPFGASRTSDFKLGRAQGAILAGIHAADAQAVINEVSTPEWKKGVGLKGTARKDDYQPELVQRIGPGFAASGDEIDAYGIAAYGTLVNERAFA